MGFIEIRKRRRRRRKNIIFNHHRRRCRHLVVGILLFILCLFLFYFYFLPSLSFFPSICARIFISNCHSNLFVLHFVLFLFHIPLFCAWNVIGEAAVDEELVYLAKYLVSIQHSTDFSSIDHKHWRRGM